MVSKREYNVFLIAFSCCLNSVESVCSLLPSVEGRQGC